MDNYVGNIDDCLRTDLPCIDLEVEGTVKTYVIRNDININIDGTGNVCYSRFELVRNPQAYEKVLSAVLSMLGQKSIIPKEEHDFEMAQHAKGIYPWNQTQKTWQK